MSRMLDPLRQTLSWQRAGENGPPVDLYETDKAVIIRLAIPGGDGGALTLTIGDESVRVRGETPAARGVGRAGEAGGQQIMRATLVAVCLLLLAAPHRPSVG